MINPISAQLRRTDYDAFAMAEETISDVIALLSNFVGFQRRMWIAHPCAHDGQVKPDSVHAEVTYVFGPDDSASPVTRKTYVEILRQALATDGRTLFRDEATNQGTHHSLEATTAEGLNLYYRVAHYVYVRVHSGCVVRTDRLPNLPALGGVTLDNDKAQALIHPDR
ncbi:hypothetical protein [Natronoglycomyces albus]|uniref:Uncharacterized protein n=1 Tax=Natronoglycomyces albus TaxID=2811108 RepID=A0A895XRH4_9ACTN|nr:hypothetical protein [Natronoglycomyces albus]QSB04860.1 hypothetical protein JQS30_13990 [Natronoglycomyces albus]